VQPAAPTDPGRRPVRKADAPLGAGTLRLASSLLSAGVLLGCSGAPAPTPTVPQETLASWSASSLVAGDLAALAVRVVAGPKGVPTGAELRVGFPHWVYGSQGVVRPPEAAKEQYGHWYLLRPLDDGLAPGAQVTWELPPVQLPRTAGPFAPLVFVDWEPVAGPVTQALVPGDATTLTVVGPTWVAPEGVATLKLRLEDAYGNALHVEQREVPAPSKPGVVRVPAAHGGWRGTSQPILVAPMEPGIAQVAWLDLHGHSGLSDGRGAAADWFREARTTRFLDGAALSDHDWQLTDAEWNTLLHATDAANERGAFVTLPAAEINIHGHEVAYFADSARLRALPEKGSRGGARTIWEETDRGLPTARVPDLLGSYLRGAQGGDPAPRLLVATHTSLARGMGTGYPLEAPLPENAAFEVYSAHGSSECDDCPRRVGGGPLEADEAVGSLWDALDAGLDVTLIAASDAHDGRPGTTNWGAWPGGLTAVEVPEVTREAVFAAIAAGHAWATTGERTLLRTRWRADAVEVFVVGDGVDAVEVVGDRAVVARRATPPQGEWITLGGLPENAWRYVRVVLPEGAKAWRGVWRPETTAAGRATR